MTTIDQTAARRDAFGSVTRVARHPIDLATIAFWCDVMGEDNPIYRDTDAAQEHGFSGVVAPPPMLSVWTMPGYREGSGTDAPLMNQVRAALAPEGFDSIVATNSEQRYARYLTVGERVAETTSIESISALKQTRVGPGHFVTTLHRFADEAGREVGSMRLTALVFRAGRASPERADRRAASTTLGAVPEGTVRLQRETLQVTTTFVVSSAYATRDLEPVHHDRDLALSQGLDDVIVNIFTSNGLLATYAARARGQSARLTSVSLRLGMPIIPGDRLVLSGATCTEASGVHIVDVVGTSARGEHVRGTVRLTTSEGGR